MLILSIVGQASIQYQDALNKFHEVTEYDILNASPGLFKNRMLDGAQ